MFDVALSGFCDEVCLDKRLDMQLAVASALGMKYVSLRFFDLGGGVKNILEANDADLLAIQNLLETYRIAVSSIGSPLGKVKLLDIDDGNANRFRNFDAYLDEEVQRVCRIARRLGVTLIRGFTFYPPRGSDPVEHIPLAAERVAEIGKCLRAEGLVYGVEVEANLVGQTGRLIAEIVRRAAQRNIVSIFDGGNLVSQGFDANATWEEWLAMGDSLGWLHVKDYRAETNASRVVDEDALAGFVPVGYGDSAYSLIFVDLKTRLNDVRERLRYAGFERPSVFLDLEPHLRKGGQFGGFSGADGFGVALRSLEMELEKAGLTYERRGWPL